MKIVFFSDIHGNKYVIPAFLREIKKENPDKIVFCGDIFGYYYYQNEIINFLETQILLFYLVIMNNIFRSFKWVSRYGPSHKEVWQ